MRADDLSDDFPRVAGWLWARCQSLVFLRLFRSRCFRVCFSSADWI